MHANHLRNLVLIGLGLVGACASTPREGTTHGGDPEEPQAVASTPDAVDEDEPGPRLSLSRSMHAASMTEVELDPTGTAALSLDADGGVRLWTDLHADEVGYPIAIPMREPTWMSLARTDDGFLAAFIDTAGAARIGRVRVGADGKTATWTTAYEHPPTRPVLELHVLEGGKEILALTEDHQLELWDPRGQRLSGLDRPSFVPWQLRISQSPDAAPAIVAVVGPPVMVQRIALRDQRLTLVGEPIAVNLDRGPNRNDLVMSPDGRQVTVMRRPKARAKRFEVEVVNLETGARGLVAAESDLGKRPRLHALSSDEVLLESGSGAGFYLDLRAASPWPPAVVDPEAPLDASSIAATQMREVALPGSTEESRFHAAVAGGTRVVARGRELVVDPLDARPVRRIHAPELEATAMALDHDGSRVAWATPGALVLEQAGGDDDPTHVPMSDAAPSVLAFVGEDHLVTLDATGKSALFELGSGSVVARSKIPFSWGVSAAAWRPEPAESARVGSLVLSTIKPHDPVHVLGVGATGFEELREVPERDRSQWPESGRPRGMSSASWIGSLGFDWASLGLRTATVVEALPDPTGRYIAFVQRTEEEDPFASWEDGTSMTDDQVVTLFDRSEGRRVWTELAPSLRDLAWSADGTKLGVLHRRGGYVFEAGTGTVVFERHDFGLRTEIEGG